MNPAADIPKLTILGGGPAGLATAYFARQAGLSFRLLEKSGHLGGNASTLQHGPFLYDTGAHRWHDRYPELTAEVKQLLGEDLLPVHAPSQIFSQGRWFDFPLSPLNLLQQLGPVALAQAGLDFLKARFEKLPPEPTFRQYAISAYGYRIAKRFLLDYSEKLWGAPTEKLAPAVAGKRLKGLNLRTFLIEALRGKQAKVTHLDGGFYYPRLGIGMIMEKMAEACGPEGIERNAQVSALHHENGIITSVTLADGRQWPVQEVASSLPLTVLLRALQPAPPAHLLELANSLQFRHLLLVVLSLNRTSVSPNASIYFPDPNLPFTRLYEPRNRSPFMAPPGQTSVVVEVPVSFSDPIWIRTNEELSQQVLQQLTATGLFRANEVIEAKVHRLHFAYPVLTTEAIQASKALLEYLETFRNLHLIGRTASFEYTHLHDHFLQAKQLVSQL